VLTPPTTHSPAAAASACNALAPAAATSTLHCRDGATQDADRICRLLGGTDKRAMGAVCEAHLDAFGQTLQEAFKQETMMGGDLRKAACAWCDGHDPTGGLE
jgi:hypothetical protein